MKGYRVSKLEYFKYFHECVVEVKVLHCKNFVFFKERFAVLLLVELISKGLVGEWSRFNTCHKFIKVGLLVTKEDPNTVFLGQPYFFSAANVCTTPYRDTVCKCDSN